MEKEKKLFKSADAVYGALTLLIFVVGFIMLLMLILSITRFDSLFFSLELLTFSSYGIEITFEDDIIKDMNAFYLKYYVSLGLFWAVLGIVIRILLLLRSTLNPVIEGKPFDIKTPKALKKIALWIVIICIVLVLRNCIDSLLAYKAFDIELLKSMELIDYVKSKPGSGAMMTCVFFVISSIFILLAYIFEYGISLQKLSDETL